MYGWMLCMYMYSYIHWVWLQTTANQQSFFSSFPSFALLDTVFVCVRIEERVFWSWCGVHRKRVVGTGRRRVVFLPFYKARVTWRYKILSYLLDYYSRLFCFYFYFFSIIYYPYQLLQKIYLFFLYLLEKK